MKNGVAHLATDLDKAPSGEVIIEGLLTAQVKLQRENAELKANLDDWSPTTSPEQSILLSLGDPGADVQPAVDGQSDDGLRSEPDAVDEGATGPSLFPRVGRSEVPARPGLAPRFRLHR